MKKKIGLCIILVIAFSNMSNAQSKSDINLEEVKKAIAESNKIYYQSYAKNDSSLFINRYAEDCIISGEYGPTVKGHQGTLDFFKNGYNKFGLRNGEITTTKIYAGNDGYFIEEGLWKSFRKDNQFFDSGTFIVVWKKTAKGWKMYKHNFINESDHVFK
jgi:ketosteroid isomerase-like protein